MVDQAEIHRKVASGNFGERTDGLIQLCNNFEDFPDKDEAWEDLIRLTEDNDRDMRRGAANALGVAFQHVPDKDEAWKDLIRLTGDEDINVLWRVADALGTAFQHVPDKAAAWKDLHRLTEDKNINARFSAAFALGTAFQHVPDKAAAWEDLHRLTRDKNIIVRFSAAFALGTAFQHVPDKAAAWEDLHRLTLSDRRWVVRCWHNIKYLLTRDKKINVLFSATFALGTAFQHVPDKDVAWKDLHRLTEDVDSSVRWRAANALGSAFSYVLNKDAAWNDLHRLTGDKNSFVRVSANHSLGRASIFKATLAESEGDFESELNNAIDFFERSSNEATYFNPSRFCLPFYRSFCKITFEKAGAEDEVHRYLAEAKSASKGSENKETLLEAVENLANALSEAQKVTDFDATKSDLKTYMQYCDRAANLISTAEDGTPGAAQVLRRGLPIIGERIRDIQEKAEALYKETRGTGTPYESLGMEINKCAGELSDRDDLQNERIASIISDNLGEFCNLHLCKIVEDLRDESEPKNKIIYIGMALSYLLPSIKSEIQNADKTMTYKTRSDEQPSQKTGHSTTVFAGVMLT